MFDIAALQAMYGANFSRSARPTPIAGTKRPASRSINGAAGAQHRPQLDRQDLLDRVDAGRRRDLRPQQLRPGPGRRPPARPLADLLQRPARRPQPPPTPARRSSRPRATSTTRCSTTATCGRPIANLTTGIGNDTLIGNDRDNVLSAGAGNDIIVTSGGNDTVSGGAGADTIHFGSGHSTLRDSAGRPQRRRGARLRLRRRRRAGRAARLGQRFHHGDPDDDQRRRIDRRAQRQLRRQRRLHPVGARQRGRRPHRGGLRQLPAQPGRRA